MGGKKVKKSLPKIPDFEAFSESQAGSDGDSAMIYIDYELNAENKRELLEMLDEKCLVDGKKRLLLIVDSEGGFVSCALAIYDRLSYLKSKGIEIVTLAEGIIASAAVVIFLAGDERIITPHSNILMHLPEIDPECCPTLNEESIAKIFAELKKQKITFAEVASERTGRPIQYFIRAMKKMKEFNAEESVKCGLAHKIQ